MHFKCHVCNGAFFSPLRSLERRIQQQSLEEVGGKTQETLHIHQSEDVYQYDSKACRATHAPAVIAQLKLKSTYPSSGTVVPCSRCGYPLTRISLHVSYAWVTLEFRDSTGMTGHCTGDTELAVLCRRCEWPTRRQEARVSRPAHAMI